MFICEINVAQSAESQTNSRLYREYCEDIWDPNKKEIITHMQLFLLLGCPTGRYGRDCSETCGDQCQGCDRFSGVCELGCLPGWTGQRCDEPCTFGNNEFHQDVFWNNLL